MIDIVKVRNLNLKTEIKKILSLRGSVIVNSSKEKWVLTGVKNSDGSLAVYGKLMKDGLNATV